MSRGHPVGKSVQPDDPGEHMRVAVIALTSIFLETADPPFAR